MTGVRDTDVAAHTTPPAVTNEEALGAYLGQIQALLCSPHMTDRERNNAVAAHVHRALLDHGGGYDVLAIAARERSWKALRRV